MPNPFVFPSEEELESQRGGDWKNLIEEEYVLEIKEVVVQKDKTSQYQPEAHDEWLVRFNAVSFANGDPVYFEDGSEPTPETPARVVAFINPTKVGMFPKPSKARKFITSAFGLGLSAGIEMPNGVEDLIGKRLIGRVYHKPDTKNPKVIRDRLDDFRPLRNRPPRPTPAKPAAEDLLAKAQEVFGEDADLKF